MILLDTCTLLWLVLDQSGLSDSARSALSAAAGRIFVSPVSAYEIGQKQARGKLELNCPASEWFALAMRLHGLREARFESSMALAASALPDLHQDPFDRLLIATAQILEFTLLTPDPLITQYRAIKTAW